MVANIDNEPVISDNVAPLPCHLNEFIITEQEILDQLRILNVNKPVSPRLLKSYKTKPGNCIILYKIKQFMD
jgi:hypothetical protein